MQTICAPGVSVRSAGQSTAEIVPAPVKETSCTAASVSVTLPVFVTTNENVTVSPTTSTAVSEDFLIEIAGVCVPVMFAAEGSEVTGSPVGGVPVAVAELSTEPASTSACCTTYVAVQSMNSSGERVRSAGHVTADSEPAPVNSPSATEASVSVTLPVFVTRNE